MISHTKRFVFVHINKTAGTSIEQALLKYANQVDGLDPGSGLPLVFGTHLTATEIRDILGADVYNSYFKFAFVRNPWDKLVSQYSYRQRFPVGHPKSTQDIDFSQWIAKHLENDAYRRLEAKKVRLFQPQVEWLCDDAGHLLVDFVGRYEQLAHDFRYVLSKIEVSVPLSQFRKSEHHHYSTYYDDRSRALVARAFRLDIERWGYQFEQLTVDSRI